ncbi:MAG: conjugal transfer mating pair stabilization protein TraG, partial [Rickettsiales bacterium]
TKELAEWKNPLSKKINFFSSSFTFGRSKEALQKQVLGTLVKSSDAVSDYLMGVSLNSSQLLKQAMTNNAILAATENYEAEFNQQQFQNVRVQVQTRSAYQTIGKQAGQWLPMVKIIIESVFYGLFPIIVLLAIIPNMTLTVLKGYFFTFFWLASWGPIYAILNRGITEYAGNKMTDGVALSLINQQNIQTITADISAMAGYFAMFVPLIAAALAKGGVAAMSSMSTAFMSVAQGAAMQATNEGVTGNLSFGNVGLNSRHAYSGITMQNDAGMLTHHHNDGSTSISRGTAESDMGYNVHASDRLENIASSSIAQETSLAQSKGSQSQQFESKGFESMIQNHRNIESSNQFSENFSAEERESFRKSQTAINDFATTHNISNGKSAEIFGGISAGMPFGIRGGITSSDQKVYEEAQKYSSDHNLSQDLNTAKQAMQSNHLNFTDSQGQSINDNFNKSAQLSKEQSTHLENAQRYSDQKQFITTNSASIDKTYDQEFYNYVKSNLADGNVSKATELFNPNDPNRHSLLDKSASEFLEDKFHKTNISENFDQDYKYQATQFLNQNSPKNLMSSEPSVQFDKEFQRIDNSALSDSTQNNYQETQDSINNMKMGNNLMGSDIYGEVKNKQDAGITGGLTLADEDDVKRAFEKKDD